MHLKEARLFQDLSEEFVARVEALATLRAFRQGATLFHEGDPATDIYILKEGRVRLTYTLPQDPTMEIRIADIGPGDNFAWSALALGGTLSSHACALAESEAFLIPARPFHDLMRGHAREGYEVMVRMAQQILSRLRQTRVELRWLHQGAR